MPDQIERALRRLEAQLPGRVSRPGENGYAAATAIWAKPVGPMPRAIVHCRMTDNVQLAIERHAIATLEAFQATRNTKALYSVAGQDAGALNWDAGADPDQAPACADVRPG